MFQTKEQDKTPEEELSEVEIGNQPKKEFKVMIVKMIKELGRRMEAQSEQIEVVFFFLAALCGLWDLSSSSRD